MDLAANTGDYDLLQKTKKKIGKHVASIKDLSGDEIIDSHRSELLSMGKSAKIDEKLIVKTSEKQTLKDFLTNPKQAIGLTAKKQALKIQESAEEIKGDLIHFALEGAKATVRSAIGGGKGLYKLAEGVESAFFSGDPLGVPFAVKKGVQKILPGVALAAASTQLPMLGAGINAIAPFAGQAAGTMAGWGMGAAGHGAGWLAGNMLPQPILQGASALAQASQPVVNGLGMMGSAISHLPGASQVAQGIGTVAETLGSLGSHVLVYLGGGKVAQAVVGKIVQTSDAVSQKALAPSENPSKYLEGMKGQYKTYIDKYKNIDQFIPTLPEGQRATVKRFLPVVAQLQEGYSGQLKGQQLSESDLNLKSIGSAKDAAKLLREKGKKAIDDVKYSIASQYKMAVENYEQLSSTIESLASGDRTGEVAALKAQLKNRVSNLEKKAEYVGLRTSNIKIERSPNKGNDVDVNAFDMTNIGKIERASKKVGKDVVANWEKTEKDVSRTMVEITETAKEQSYPLKKAMSEGSPGPTFWIRENWKKTGDFVRKEIQLITVAANQLFNSGQKNVGKINIPTGKDISKESPDLLRFQHFAKVDPERLNSIPDPTNGSAKKLSIKSVDNIVQKVGTTNSLHDLNILESDIVESVAFLRQLKEKIQKRVQSNLGVSLKSGKEDISKKAEERSLALASRYDSILSTNESAKSGVNKKYDLVKSKIKQRMNKEVAAVKHDDTIRQKQREEIQKLFKERDNYLYHQMLDSMEGKTDEDKKAIRDKFTTKRAKLENRKNNELYENRDQSQSTQSRYDQLISQNEQKRQSELSPLAQKDAQSRAKYSQLQAQINTEKNKELQQFEKYRQQVSSIDKKINTVKDSYSLRVKTVGEDSAEKITKGTVEYYDNFLGKLKGGLAQRLKLKGKEGDHLMDQIMTFAFAGASTISPQLGPMMAAAPLFMPLIPSAIATLGIANLIAPAIGKIDQAIRQQQPIDQRFQTLQGSPEAGQLKRKEIVGLSEKYNISAAEGTQNFSQMAIAARDTNLTQKEMIGLYEGISASIRALGLSTQDAGLIFMAYTQMLSKGKISMEELRQQLGERFPPAMSVFAKALGTSAAGLEDLISRGSVSTEQWVPKVTKVLKEDFGGAALEMGDSYTSAITKIENTNFALNKNFSDTYGGLFATVTNAWGGVLATMNSNFKLLNALALSGLIAVGASIGIGLTYILKMPAINNFMVGGTSILLSTFKFSLKTLTPFLIGTLADVMDDVFGTKNNVMENMSKGVGNFFSGVFGGIDKSIRNTTGVSLFDPFKVKENPFEPYLKGIDELKQKLGGFVELTALVLMFEQVRVLGNMFLMPLFKNMASATVGWGKAIKEALLNKDTGIKTIGDLFGGSLIGLTGVDREGTIKKNKAEFDALRQQQKALAQDNPLANFGRARESVIQSDMSKGLSRKQILENRKTEFNTLKGVMVPSVENDPLVQYHKKRDELLTKRMRQESRARALAFTGQIALEAGLALGIMSFAKGDFSNNLGGELNKAKTKMIAAIDGIKSALDGLKGTAKEVGTALSGIKLPSKGAQLDIRNILGDESKDFKWDDLITNINKQGLGAAKARQALTSTLQFLTGSQKGTIGAGIAEYIGVPDVSNIEKNIKDAQKIGLNDFYVQDKNLLPTMAQDQLLNFGKDLEKLQSDIKSKLKNNAFDINDLSKPLSSEYKSLINEVTDIDKKLQGMGAKRLSLATINTTQSRKEIAALDIEINALLKERKDKVMPFGKIEDNLKDWKSSLKKISETIASDPSIPLAAKTALNNLLKPSIDYVNSVSDYLKGQGIGKLAQPLLDVWDSVINKLRDVDLALQKVKTGNEKSFAQAQIRLYKSNLGTVALSPALQKESLKDLQNQESLLQQTIDKKQALLNQVLAVANVGDTIEKKSKIEEIKKEILDASKELDNTRVGIAKSLYEINNNFIAEDALRNYKRSLEDWNLEMKRQAIDYTQQIESYRREVEDAGISASRENRDLAESFSDLMNDLGTQLKTAQNEFIDIQDKIKNTRLKRELLEISPGIDSYGKQIATIFANLREALSGNE